MEERNVKKNRLLRICGLIGLFLLVFGITYALFQITLNGTKKNRIKVGTLDVVIENESAKGVKC